MDRKSSPEQFPPDLTGTPLVTVHNDDNHNMATTTIVTHPPPRRYRPAPAKTFQCRGYGECRMVFSRSEHLARHIRKHTGERPFSCHCGKQFSRLDNLRQHAQTVHADKQEQNERMMRDLTAVHASMTAANKLGGPRAGRRGAHAPHGPIPSSPTAPNGNHMNGTGGSPTASHHSVDTTLLIKEEDLGLSLHPHHPHHRTDPTSAFDTDHSFYNHQPSPWHVQGPADLDPNARHNSPHQQAFQQQQPYLSFTPSLTFGLPSDPPRSRPTTSSGSAERLPPLSAIIPSPETQQSLQEYQQQQLQHNQLQQQGYVPSTLRPRPGTGSGRPGSSSANAFFFGTNNKSPSTTAFYNPTLAFGRPYGEYDGAPASATAAHASQDPSPFYFHPDDAQTNGGSTSPPTVNGNANGRSPASTTHGSGSASPGSATPPGGMQTRSPSHLGGHPTPVLSRKRTLGGPDGPYDGMYAAPPVPAPPPPHPNGGGPDYDYGSDSRPQSRRLSVLELCNENGGNVPVEVFGMGMHPHQHQQQHQHQQHGMGMVNGMMGGMMMSVNVNGTNGFAPPGDIYHHHQQQHRGVSRSPSEVIDLAQAVQQQLDPAAATAMRRASSVASMRSHNNGSAGPDMGRRGKMSPPTGSGRRPAPAPLTVYGEHHHQQQQQYHQQQQQQMSYHQQQFAPPQPHSPYAPAFPVSQSHSPTTTGGAGDSATTASTPVTPFSAMPAYLQQQQQQRASPRHLQESPLPSPHPSFVEGFAYQQQQQQQQGPGYPGGYAVGHHQM